MLVPLAGTILCVLGALWALSLSRDAAPAAVLTPAGRAAALPELGALSAFHFTDEKGQRFGADELRGRVWVANFIFTRCPTICPRFTAEMRKLQQSTSALEGLHLVSFSVDPAYDTPEILAKYARAHGADPSRWSFLTGDPSSVRGTIVGGFKIALQDAPDANPEALLHGTHFVLVDRALRIRGYYASDDPEAVARLLQDLPTLLAEAPPNSPKGS